VTWQPRLGALPAAIEGQIYSTSPFRVTDVRLHVEGIAFALAVALAVAGCGPERLSPSAERGRQVYLSQCTACHATDPARPGPIGPPVKGSSKELLEAKLLRGEYPPGYRPKRATRIMPPQTQVAGDIQALADYLQ